VRLTAHKIYNLGERSREDRSFSQRERLEKAEITQEVPEVGGNNRATMPAPPHTC